MWLVRAALRRPYTSVVAALFILMLGPLTIARTPVDIFPAIDIPVIAVVWNYPGLSAEEIANRLVTIFERGVTTTVNDIEHIESQSLRGTSVVKLFFHPGAHVEMAQAQATSSVGSQLRQMPPGTNPALIISYNASNVPVLQLGLSGPGISEQQLYDIGGNFIRVQLATVQGAATPFPYGGKQPQIQVDLDPAALQAKGLSPADVVNAVAAQNLILPAGTSKIGSREYEVEINASPRQVEQMNDLPIKMTGRTPIYIRDVAHVRNGYPPQTNMVRVDGQRSVLMIVQKNSNASTLEIISRIKQALPRVARTLPPELDIKPLGDQSVFVRASIASVIREAVLAACLTALMILLFLGSWRSTLIISVSIPLSILSSIILLHALGETINIMTLGGLALAVGILVDDATVSIENINAHLERGKALEPAILDGAEQIAVPALVSMLCICIVFVPMFFLPGVARFLFVPLAEAVVFAMIASYLLARTLVPTMAKYLLKAQAPDAHQLAATSRNPLVRVQHAIDNGFLRVRAAYRITLTWCVGARRPFALLFFAGCVASLLLVRWVGEDFFPSVDTGQFKLHVRAPTGTRIEETAALCDHIEDAIRRVIPPGEVSTIVDNIGLPYSSINLIYSNSQPTGVADADIMVALAPGHHPTDGYVHDLRLRLASEFPGVETSFIPADIVTQTLNFGLPAPIDIQVAGRNLVANRQFAAKLLTRVAQVPGVVDAHIHQPFNQPVLHMETDRTMAIQTGFTQRDLATNLLISLSGSSQTAPTFWVNPATGVSYPVAIQTPQYRVDSLQDLGSIPVGAPGARPQEMQAFASISRRSSMATVSHYNAQPVIDIYGSVQRRDLGSVSRELSTILEQARPQLPRGSELSIRGQIATMNESFRGLVVGLGLAIILVYLLIVVNFQSWLDPFIIICALPAALAGIVWLLFLSHTTISVPALTGAIMCMGVATANSILIVSFAKGELARGRSAVEAAVDAGFTRFRPVLMTALAMIIGMVPMALGLGEGGEQNAPLGRAVIGGLAFATVATLFFVPSVFALLHGGRAGGRTISNSVEQP